MTVEQRGIIALSALCLVLLGITIWALATRRQEKWPVGTGRQLWVATDGDNANPGTRERPWSSIQHAATLARPGDTVHVEGGTYEERVEITTSGEPQRPITFEATGGPVLLDGSSFGVPAGQSAMVLIDSRRYITIRGFEIAGYRTNVSGHVPIGILVTGASDHVRLSDNFVHDMGTTFEGRNGGDAHGIGVFGTEADHPISDVAIVNNELADLTLGSSEALVVNGNVTDFVIDGNSVHDTNNIAIDVIGFEGTAPDPTVDQARDGVLRNNRVWNVDSYGNPAYGRDRSADGIYVDGGRDVLIENNNVSRVNIGIELASEHAGRSTRNVTVRNNIVQDATAIGIAIGGYDRHRGSTEDCLIVNNTIVNTNGVELLVQFDARNNMFANNVIVAGARHDFVENQYRRTVGNVIDNNLYYSTDGDAAGTWQWKGTTYDDFQTWRARSGNDRSSAFADPAFVDRGARDYRLTAGSPAIDAGAYLAASGTSDFAGKPRAQAGGIDVGAFERTAPSPSPTPSVTGPVTYVTDLDWVSRRNGWGPPEIDRSNGERPIGDGGPIVVGSVAYEHGVGVHAPSRIVIDLGGRCSLFLADVGLDEEVQDQGSVVFEVRDEGERLASSGLVRGSQAPVLLTADVTDVDHLALVVRPGGDGRAFDHADWAAARLSCGDG